MRRGTRKDFKKLHPDLCERFNDRNGRTQLFQDWMEAKEDWAAVKVIMKRKAMNSRRIRAKMMAKTQKEI